MDSWIIDACSYGWADGWERKRRYTFVKIVDGGGGMKGMDG